MTMQSLAPSIRALALCVMLPGAVLGFGAATLTTACTGSKSGSPGRAPTEGVVGRVTELRGEVTWSVGDPLQRTPLNVGDQVRAEWTVHTGPGAALTVKLSNGHTWSLSGGFSKRVSTVDALTLPPVREGALARASDLGGRRGKDRTAAAGLHHERSLAKKAAPSRLEDETGAAGVPLAEGTDGDKGKEEVSHEPAAAEDQPSAAPRPTAAPTDKRTPDMPRRQLVGGAMAPARGASHTGTTVKEGLIGRGYGGGAVPGGGAAPMRPADVRTMERLPSQAPRPQPQPPPRRPTTGSVPEASPSPPAEPKTVRADKAAEQPQVQRPPDAKIRQALLPHLKTLRAVLGQHGLSGPVTLVIYVDGVSGRITAVQVVGKSATEPVNVALKRAFARVTLPRAKGPYLYRYPLRVP